MLTYKKAKTLYNKAKAYAAMRGWHFDSRNGCRIRENLYIVKYKNVFALYTRYIEIFNVNSKNEYRLGSFESKKMYCNLVNRYTPARMRMRDKRLLLGRIPYYYGLKMNSKGHVLIPEVWSEMGRGLLHCDRCRATFTDRVCTNCIR